MPAEAGSSIDEARESNPSREELLHAERDRRSGIREAVKHARREHRAHLELPVRFSTGTGEALVAGRARNLSIGGMFIETDRPAPFGASIVVQLALPEMHELAELSATVRWTNADGMGVQFGVMGARETHGIVKLLEP